MFALEYSDTREMLYSCMSPLRQVDEGGNGGKLNYLGVLLAHILCVYGISVTHSTALVTCVCYVCWMSAAKSQQTRRCNSIDAV